MILGALAALSAKRSWDARSVLTTIQLVEPGFDAKQDKSPLPSCLFDFVWWRNPEEIDIGSGVAMVVDGFRAWMDTWESSESAKW